MIANLPPQYRSQLHTIQLAALANMATIKKHGIEAALQPIIEELHKLEETEIDMTGIPNLPEGTPDFIKASRSKGQSL